MEKANVYKCLINKLEEELIHATCASKDAASYATHDESKAESQWDTQGLEASYLAAGQAGQAKELIDAIASIKGYSMSYQEVSETVIVGSLLETKLNGSREWFLLSPAGGGEFFEVDGKDVTTITRESPLGQQLIGKVVGDSFTLPNGTKGTIEKIL